MFRHRIFQSGSRAGSHRHLLKNAPAGRASLDPPKEPSQYNVSIPEEVILSAAKDLPAFSEGFFAALRMTSDVPCS